MTDAAVLVVAGPGAPRRELGAELAAQRGAGAYEVVGAPAILAALGLAPGSGGPAGPAVAEFDAPLAAAAAAVRARTVVLLDADAAVGPGWLAAHLAAARAGAAIGAGEVAIGLELPLGPARGAGRRARIAGFWLEELARAAGARTSATDLWGLNVALPRETLAAVDASPVAAEPAGAAAIDAALAAATGGRTVVAVEGAAARRRLPASVGATLDWAGRRGGAAARLARRHPGAAWALGLPTSGAGSRWGARLRLGVVAALGPEATWERRWREALARARSSGARAVAPADELRRLARPEHAGAPAGPIVELDLAEGFAAAGEALGAARAAGAVVRLGDEPVGVLAPLPGARALAAADLASALAGELELPLLAALARGGPTPAGVPPLPLGGEALRAWFERLFDAEVAFERSWQTLAATLALDERARLRARWQADQDRERGRLAVVESLAERSSQAAHERWQALEQRRRTDDDWCLALRRRRTELLGALGRPEAAEAGEAADAPAS